MSPEHSLLLSDYSLTKKVDTVVPNACVVEPMHELAMRIELCCSLKLSLLRVLHQKCMDFVSEMQGFYISDPCVSSTARVVGRPHRSDASNKLQKCVGSAQEASQKLTDGF